MQALHLTFVAKTLQLHNVFQKMYGVMLLLAGVYRCLCLCLQMPSYAMQFKKKDTAQHSNAKCRTFFGVIGVDKCFTLVQNLLKKL